MTQKTIETCAVGGSSAEVGSVVQAVVLDVAKVGRLVDLSLKQVFVDKINNESATNHSEKKVKLLPSLCPLSMS